VPIFGQARDLGEVSIFGQARDLFGDDQGGAARVRPIAGIQE
jgi:hypothetical protein